MTSPIHRAIARPRSGCEGKNAFTHTPGLGVVWGSKHDVFPPIRQAHHAVLPTKTSLDCIQFACISFSLLSVGPQVSSISFMKFVVCLDFRHGYHLRSHWALWDVSIYSIITTILCFTVCCFHCFLWFLVI